MPTASKVTTIHECDSCHRRVVDEGPYYPTAKPEDWLEAERRHGPYVDDTRTETPARLACSAVCYAVAVQEQAADLAKQVARLWTPAEAGE